jgi:TetR/AcrR family transcriptional repressor of nem operon
MRYSAGHREKTRSRILDAASVVFKRAGFQAGSVDDVMAEAGLTAGAFYSHFKSKDELFAEAFIQTLKNGRLVYGKDDESLAGADRIRAMVAKYLSPAHWRFIDKGCPMPPLLADLPRRSEETRRAFQDVVGEIAATLEPHLSAEDLSTEKGQASTGSDQTSKVPDQALALLAVMVGGLSLARAVSDEQFANRILSSCRHLIDTLLDHAQSKTDDRSEP